jgi:hemerythrin superfamily protein
MPASEQDLIDLLVADHRRLESLFAEIETSPRTAVRRAALDAAIATLARHSAAEEEFLHPALREHLPAGQDIAAYETREHTQVDELVERLSRLNDVDPAFGELLAALLGTVRLHMQEEETELFPRLATACAAGTLLELGERLKSVRVTD